MSSDWDADDFARLMALEHAWYAVTLVSAGNYAGMNGIKIKDAVQQLRDAVESSLYDHDDLPGNTRQLMRGHLKRMFDEVEQMAGQADRPAA
ncbi:hypothetical protein [Maricaulis sp.]|uniref:hypothetical protein n=1 Tax=Maricaulis sp. TaxID=1486257 RepID=UPI00260A3F48|nr:hypothetical protein [Maricaulis sp.]